MVISFIGFAGTCGKTLNCLNIGETFVRSEKKVLFIDMDPSAKLTDYFCKNTEGFVTLFDILGKNIGIEKAILHSEERNCDYVPAEHRMNLFENTRELILFDDFLEKTLTTIKGKYDYIFMDCPPMADVFTILALKSSDMVIMPVIPEFMDEQRHCSDVAKVIIADRMRENDVKRCFLLNLANSWEANKIPEARVFILKEDEMIFNTAIMRDRDFDKLYFDETEDLYDELNPELIRAYMSLTTEIEEMRR